MSHKISRFPVRLGYLLVLVIAYIPLFCNLDELPIRCWDESRPATNTREMMMGGNPLVLTWGGQPDIWSTKPPLLIWVQSLSCRIFGMTTLGLRLPSALAALAVCMMLYWFAARKLHRPLLGLLAVGVLVCTPGYVSEHVTRTGDFDSLMICFMMAAALSFFCYAEERRTKHLIAFFAAMMLGMLTKGIAAVLFIPAIAGYAFCRKGLVMHLLRSRAFYGGLALCLLPVAAYYLLREHYNPGYLQAVFDMLTAVPAGGGLSAAEEVLLSLGLSACFTAFNADATRRHIRRALDMGVDRRAILQVLQMTAHLGVHACALGMPALLDAIDPA